MDPGRVEGTVPGRVVRRAQTPATAIAALRAAIAGSPLGVPVRQTRDGEGGYMVAGGPDVFGGPDELVEYVAREIQVRGLCGPAVLFLEASRPYHPLGPGAMLFFDPVLRGLFADMAEVHRIMADDDGIERLIERLEEIEDDLTLDA